MAFHLRIDMPNDLERWIYFEQRGIRVKRSENGWDLERLNVGQGVGPRSTMHINTVPEKKSLPGASAQSWRGGFVKSDGTQVRLFVPSNSKIPEGVAST